MEDVMALSFRGVAEGIDYAVESCVDLGGWSADDVTLGDPDADGWRTATVPLDAPRRFMRIRVSAEP